jgi:hypothetical protein
VLGQLILGDPPPPFDLPLRSCFDDDLYALPTGRIAGTVIGPDDKPVHVASVNLYRADESGEGKPGLLGYQGGRGPHDENWEPFPFDHLPAGNYILVFNYSDSVEQATPFHRTFYPGATKPEDTQIIHLATGQQITNADIHVCEAAARREITVRIAWSAKEPTGWVPVSILAKGRGTRTRLAEHKHDDPHTYKLALWQSERYSIQATTPCHAGGEKEATTNTVVVDGKDFSVSEITLTFDKDWCSDK